MVVETLVTVVVYAAVVCLLVVLPLLVVRVVGGSLDGHLDAEWRATLVEAHGPSDATTGDEPTTDAPPTGTSPADVSLGLDVDRPRPRG